MTYAANNYMSLPTAGGYTYLQQPMYSAYGSMYPSAASYIPQMILPSVTGQESAMTSFAAGQRAGARRYNNKHKAATVSPSHQLQSPAAKMARLSSKATGDAVNDDKESPFIGPELPKHLQKARSATPDIGAGNTAAAVTPDLTTSMAAIASATSPMVTGGAATDVNYLTYMPSQGVAMVNPYASMYQQSGATSMYYPSSGYTYMYPPGWNSYM